MKLSYFYFFVPALVFAADRLTKYWVMYHTPLYQINQFVTIDLTLNRGISFGLFHSQSQMIFSLVNLMIALVVCMLILYMYQRVQQGYWIVAELSILTGAISNNLIDRYWYGGVIDFISLSYGKWHFAVFNVADVAIFCGVVAMLLFEYFIKYSDNLDNTIDGSHD